MAQQDAPSQGLTEVKSIGVIGAGQMGSGIAHVCALAGYDVKLSDVSAEQAKKALEVIAGEVRACTRCRLHATRTQAVPGEGDPSTEVVFVGEGPGFNEDRQGRPFVGRAGDLLVRLLGSIGWRREDVFITNVVKCRPWNRTMAPSVVRRNPSGVFSTPSEPGSRARPKCCRSIRTGPCRSGGPQ